VGKTHVNRFSDAISDHFFPGGVDPWIAQPKSAAVHGRLLSVLCDRVTTGNNTANLNSSLLKQRDSRDMAFSSHAPTANQC
jgi:hypothetical protein